MKDIVEAARGGGTDDLDRLIEAVWPAAYRLAYAVLGEAQLAEDAAQEACVVLYRSISKLRSVDAFRVWFSRIVVREAGKLRRRSVQASVQIRTVAVPADDTTPIDVWRALDSLPKHLRDVVVLRYFEEFNSSEIGTVLGIPAPTVRFRLMVAKRRLRPLLDDKANENTQGVESHVIGF